MKCAQCGYHLSAFDTVCEKCGAAVNAQPARPPFSGTAPKVSSVPNVSSVPANQPSAAPFILPSAPVNSNDKPDTLYALIGFFMPIVGFIIYLVSKKDVPLKAGSALKGSLWGTGATFLLVIALFIIGIAVSDEFEAAKRHIDSTSPVAPNPPVVSNPPVASNSPIAPNPPVVSNPPVAPNALLSERESLEQWLPSKISAELARTQNINIPCTKLQLIEMSQGNYSGVAFFQDGSAASLKVTSDGNGCEWQFDN